MKKKWMKSIYAMLRIFVCLLFLAGCNEEYSGPSEKKQPEPEPEPDPVTVVEVNKLSCNAVKTVWESENATLTRSSAYDPIYRTNMFSAATTTKYTAEVKYSDGSYKEASQEYITNNLANVFLGKGTQYVKDISTLTQEPEPSVKDIDDLGTLKTWTWEGYSAAITIKTSKSVNSLDFGKVVKDLCEPGMDVEFVSAKPTYLRDSLEYKLYDVEFTFKAAVEEGEDNIRKIIVTKRFAEKQNGDIPDPNDPEHIGYLLRDKKFVFLTERTSKSSATVYELFSDGTEKKIAEKYTTVYNWHKASEDQEFVVASFSYVEREGEEEYRMVTDGTSRTSDEDENIFLTGYLTTRLTGTTAWTYRFEGHFEIPVYTDPDGKPHTMAYEEYNSVNLGLANGEQSSKDGYDILPVISRVNMDFNSKYYELNSTVILKKPSGSIDDRLSGLSVINVRVVGEYIKYDLVRHFTNQPSTTTPMQVLHMGEQTAEDRKETAKRSYEASSFQVDSLSSTRFDDGRHSGDYVSFTKTYRYADFDVVVTNKIRINIYYSEGGFSALIFPGNAECVQQGYILGTEDLGDEKKHIFDDVISYNLNLGDAKAAGCEQTVRYIDIIPTPDKTLTKVEEEGHKDNEHYLLITFSDNSVERDTITVEKPVKLIGKTLADMNRDNVRFGKGTVDHSQTPVESKKTTVDAGKGKVTATPYSQNYPVSYNAHQHSIDGEYEKYYYSYTYKGVTKGCDLTSPVLKAENTDVVDGTVVKDTVGVQIFTVTPITFKYEGTYDSQKPACEVKTNVRSYIGDVKKKKLESVQELKVIGLDHYIKINFDDHSYLYDTVTVAKPVSLQGGKIDDIYRDDWDFGKGDINHTMSSTPESPTTSGRVTATPYTQTYPVTYKKHDHKITGKYEKYVYSYSYEGITKSCNLTSPKLEIENTEVNIGTKETKTIGMKIYEVAPVTFHYYGTYGDQHPYCTVNTTVYKFVSFVTFKTDFTFVSISRVLTIDESKFVNCILLKATGEENGFQVVIPELGVDKFVDLSTVKNPDNCVSAVWNGTEFIPCEVLVDNNNQIFKYNGGNSSGNKALPMGFKEAVMKGIKNYSGDINTSTTPIMTGTSFTDENGVINVYVGGNLVLSYASGKN